MCEQQSKLFCALFLLSFMQQFASSSILVLSCRQLTQVKACKEGKEVNMIFFRFDVVVSLHLHYNEHDIVLFYHACNWILNSWWQYLQHKYDELPVPSASAAHEQRENAWRRFAADYDRKTMAPRERRARARERERLHWLNWILHANCMFVTFWLCVWNWKGFCV